MKTFSLPGTDMVVPNVVLGLMRIQDKTDDEVRTLVSTARDCGITFLDHADVYGSSLHGCERRFAEALQLTSSEREQFVIQSKAGIVPKDGPYFDFSYEHILESVDGSLKALGTDYLDILLLHRPDALVEPEEVARAFDELSAAGKVRAFGVSNQTPRQIDLLRRYVTQPIVANQLQLSITHAPMIAQGVAANMQGLDQSIVRDDGIVDYCRLNDITVQAWSPFQAGFFDGPFLGSDRYVELNAVVDRLADKYGVPAEAIAVAWITRHPAKMQVVLGTTTPERVAAAAQGSDLPLTRAEWYELFRAAGYTVP
ncbi:MULTISPECIES: aldo/keto reductase [Streptomyces]|uniref:Aldo/keto reductase n=1 Tax=Streptomyces spinosisporus TaxID=2927582 RepID=A0ABS9XWV0_9ACTN|nr:MULTISPECIES: aldo/keto reductase [Streptomyces]MCI3246370.1 aldo/keto reductase [Streptomyces spinosisporus]WUB41327.1 aldo/keto reductase [Streptomyces sp. NBC_00588]